MSTQPCALDLIASHQALSRNVLDGLTLDGVGLAQIAAQFGTPTHVIGADSLRARAATLRAAMPYVAIHYAVKANDHLAILSILAGLGFGADVVSGGEFSRAIAAGFAPAKIVFSGVGKTGDELRLALAGGCGQINVESAEELEELALIAASMKITARVALRINPDIDAGTHDKISTGRAGDKFGVPHDSAAALYARGAALPFIEMRGLAVHIGSQIFSVGPFQRAYDRLAGLVRTIRAAGSQVDLVDCGGGLGVAYHNETEVLPEACYGAIKAAFGGLGVELAVEPGRWCVAPCGVLVARVIRTRLEAMEQPMIVIDAAMNDFMRPAMYGSYHAIMATSPADLVAPVMPTDVVGPICESSDVFGRARTLPALGTGAVVAILDTGAYGAVMRSNYNSRADAAQVLVENGQAKLIRARGEVSKLWAREIVPG